jgi:hypothetical protein
MAMPPDEPNPAPSPTPSPAPDWSQAWADYYAWYAWAAWAANQGGQTGQPRPAGPAQSAPPGQPQYPGAAEPAQPGQPLAAHPEQPAQPATTPYTAAAASAAAYGAMSLASTAATPDAGAPATVATSSTAYAVELVATRPARSSRAWAILSLLLLKIVALVPHLLILAVFLVVGALVFLMAQVAVLCTARYPRGFYDFVAGVLRWQVRVRAFALGLSDRYPPFALDSGGTASYPVDLIVRRPPRSSRLWAINYFLSVVSVAYFVDPSAALWLTTRTAATLPHLFILLPLFMAMAAAWLVAQFIVVGRGAYPRGLHEFITDCLRWSARVEAFWFGLTDKYPPFELTSAQTPSDEPGERPGRPAVVAPQAEIGYKLDSPPGEPTVGH